MKTFLQFSKTTLIGGLVFLVPLIVIIVVIGKAVQLIGKITQPLAALIPIDSIAGVAITNLIATTAIVLLCFLAGLAARITLASEFIRASERRFLSRLPGYTLLKAFVDSIVDSDGGGMSMRPVLIKLDDSSQIAFEVEHLTDGRVVTYVPAAPNPWSGSVLVLEADRVEPLPINTRTAMQNIRMAGRGTNEFLGTGEVKSKP
jgi:uncharacterized membrane protein